jgi:hypothetical protein
MQVSKHALGIMRPYEQEQKVFRPFTRPIIPCPSGTETAKAKSTESIPCCWLLDIHQDTSLSACNRSDHGASISPWRRDGWPAKALSLRLGPPRRVTAMWDRVHMIGTQEDRCPSSVPPWRLAKPKREYL